MIVQNNNYMILQMTAADNSLKVQRDATNL